MNIHEIEDSIASFAGEAVLLDSASQAEVSVFLDKLKNFAALLETTKFNVISAVIQITLEHKEKILQSPADLINQSLTMALSSIQGFLTDIENSQDLSNKVEIYKQEFKKLICGEKVESSQSSLSQSQQTMIPEFVSDAVSVLEDIEGDILELEKDTGNEQLINKIFREFHTLKGDCNLLSLSNVSALAHSAEELLTKMREKSITADSRITGVLLNVVDVIKSHLCGLSDNFEVAQRVSFQDHIQSIEQCLKKTAAASIVKLQEPSIVPLKNNNHQSQTPDGDKDMSEQEKKLADKKKSVQTEEFKAQIPQLDLSEGSDILTEFVAEAMDHLSTAEESIMILENSPDDSEAVNAVFRSFHTLKGVSGFLNLNDIRTLAHVSETMLDMVRNKDLTFAGTVADLTYSSIDSLRKLLNLLQEQVQGNGELKSPYLDVGALVGQLKGVIEGKPVVTKPKKPIGEILIDEGSITPEELDEALIIQKDSTPDKKIGEILTDMHAVSKKDVGKAIEVQKGVVDSSIKIDVGKLDALIELVGELVITETQVVQNPIIRAIENRGLSKDLAELDRITRRLQENAMSMRLVPVKSTFQKMLRILRDLSKKTGKKFDVVLKGEETEIDKNMVELISDPLVHMVRNSADHGIESSDARVTKGKAANGEICLSAFHRGGNVVVEIKDDGAGLNKEKILKKAVEKGLVEQNETLSDSRIFNMIFEPGFSTAEKVTDVSGRGVGMDVVKRNIEKLRGKIDIWSEKDKGSKFSINLPITLAIIEGIVILIGKDRYILPISSVIEFLKPQEEFRSSLINQGEVYRVHDDVLPLIRLSDQFGIQSKCANFEEMTICVIETDHGRTCLVVDELLGQQQVVIKSLGERLRNIKGVSGGAILGDGHVGLILDVNGIVDLMRHKVS